MLSYRMLSYVRLSYVILISFLFLYFSIMVFKKDLVSPNILVADTVSDVNFLTHYIQFVFVFFKVVLSQY